MSKKKKIMMVDDVLLNHATAHDGDVGIHVTDFERGIIGDADAARRQARKNQERKRSHVELEELASRAVYGNDDQAHGQHDYRVDGGSQNRVGAAHSKLHAYHAEGRKRSRD